MINDARNHEREDKTTSLSKYVYKSHQQQDSGCCRQEARSWSSDLSYLNEWVRMNISANGPLTLCIRRGLQLGKVSAVLHLPGGLLHPSGPRDPRVSFATSQLVTTLCAVHTPYSFAVYKLITKSLSVLFRHLRCFFPHIRTVHLDTIKVLFTNWCTGELS
jgi:hypothetical protein